MRIFAMFGQILRLSLCGFIVLGAVSCRAEGGTLPEDERSALILAYHRIGEDAYPDSNLRAEQFASHIEEILSNGYTVRPLADIVAAVRGGEKLPAHTMVLTFEGGYRSAYEHAFPLLLRHQIPFTVFFSSGAADSGSPQYLSWRELKELRRSPFVSFGLLPAAYDRLYDRPREEILAELNKAKMRFREELGAEPEFFSYPFGEYTPAYQDIVAGHGFTAAFGLHSGVLHPASDFYAAPRFSMTESYGDIERFRLVANALPFPVADMEPPTPYLDSGRPVIGFSIPPALGAAIRANTAALSCFIAGQKPPKLEMIGTERVEIRPLRAFEDGRTRVNCTFPATGVNGNTSGWRWLGLLFIKKSGSADISLQQGALH